MAHIGGRTRPLCTFHPPRPLQLPQQLFRFLTFVTSLSVAPVLLDIALKLKLQLDEPQTSAGTLFSASLLCDLHWVTSHFGSVTM